MTRLALEQFLSDLARILALHPVERAPVQEELAEDTPVTDREWHELLRVTLGERIPDEQPEAIQAEEQQAALAALSRDLQRALASRELTQVYQPIFNLQTRRPVSAELLSRWNHPESGLIPPSVFLPLLEQEALTPVLDGLVLEAAVEAVVSLRDHGIDIPVSMNLTSGPDTQFMSQLMTLSQKSGLSTADLTFEITESRLHPDVLDATSDLHASGWSITIDDFGTGYSSLSSLQEYPFDTLKIDRSLSQVQTRTEHTIVQAIVGMAGSMGASTVAMGIESAAQMETLAALGVDLGQGFLFARPLPLTNMVQYLLGPDYEEAQILA